MPVSVTWVWARRRTFKLVSACIPTRVLSVTDANWERSRKVRFVSAESATRDDEAELLHEMS